MRTFWNFWAILGKKNQPLLPRQHVFTFKHDVLVIGDIFPTQRPHDPSQEYLVVILLIFRDKMLKLLHLPDPFKGHGGTKHAKDHVNLFFLH